MQPDSFAHLHVHSKFSLDDGVSPVEELVEAAALHGMAAVALTDHNSVAGAVRFARACRERSLHAVYGAEIEVLPLGAESYGGKTFRTVILAENDSGYGNLVALLSEAWRRRSDEAPPHISLRRAAGRRTGLIVLAGGLRTELFSLLARGDVAAVGEHVESLVGLFERDRLAFEISEFGHPESARVLPLLAEIAGFVGAPLIATNDVHYVLPEDDFAWRFLRNAPITGPIYPRKFLREARTRHLASADEMLERMPQWEAALRASAEMAQRCRVSLGADAPAGPPGGRRRFPIHDFERGRDAESDLWDRAFLRATQVYGGLNEKLKERLNLELDYIRREGLADYYQLLCRISQHLAERNIVRGSGQGRLLTSIVAYVLGLTEIDPLEYKLQFFGERIGNGAAPADPAAGLRAAPAPPAEDPKDEGAGAAPPVFSIALPSRSLEDVFRFVSETYGPNRVARAGKYGESHKGKLFSQLCEWAQLPRARVHELISQNILDGRARQPERMADLLDQAGSTLTIKNPRLLAYLTARLHPRLLPIRPIEGLLVISGEDLDRITPRERREGVEVAQIEADDLRAFGMPQIHLETLHILDALDEALRWIRLEGGQEIDLSAIPRDDREAFDLLGAGATNGVPPFQDVACKALLRRHAPRTLTQLVKVKLEMAPDDARPAGDEFTNAFMQCLLGYRAAYLKARHPVSFLTAMLNNSFRDRKQLGVLWREVERRAIRTLPPNINNSPYEFEQANDAIRVGLRIVHLVGEKCFQEIERVRRGGEFADLADFCRRTDPKLVPRPVIENLIRAGAFDVFAEPRAQMLAALPTILETHRPRAAIAPADASLFSAMGLEMEASVEETPEARAVAEFPLQHMLSEERRVTGFVVTHSPLEPYREYLERSHALLPEQVGARHDGKRVFIAGHVDDFTREGPALESSSVLLLDFEGVAVHARHPEAEKFAPAIFAGLPVLIGGKIRMRGHEPMALLTYCATLRDLVAQARHTRSVIFNLGAEDKSTLKYLHATLKRYPGHVTCQTRGYRGGGFGSGRWLSRIESAKVFWCPPLADELRQILPEDCISVQMDADI